MKERMRKLGLIVLLALAGCASPPPPRVAVAPAASGSDVPHSYADALAYWEKHTGSAASRTYLAEFVDFNNHYRLNNSSGCYQLGNEAVHLLLVITHPADSQSAVVENVLSDVDSPKARCFKKVYVGLLTKVPPYVPFVVGMDML